jgi:MoxR-like ATPase
MHAHFNNQTIVFPNGSGPAPLRGGNNPAPSGRRLLAGRAYAVPQILGDINELVDLTQTAANLRQLGDLVNSQFVDRAEMVEATLTALAAGEHCFIYGPPGTAKTALIEAITAGIGGTFGERQITAETTTDEIFGPIDAIAFSQGQYTRRWSGIALADVFYINEVWEASSTVTNIFKTALEGRIVHDGDVIRPIPLLSAIADSNHVSAEKNQQADWDRFLVRLQVNYIHDADLFGQMLTSDAGSVQTPQLTSPDELRLLAAASELLALDPPADLKEALRDLWRELGQNGRAVSDRRWRRTLKLACASALLEGLQTPGPRHLSVARWTLWNDLDERENVANLVMSKCDPLAGEVLNLEALLADLKQAKGTVRRNDAVARQDLITKGRRLSKEAGKLLAQGVNGYKGRLEAVVSQADQIWKEVLDW